MGRRLRVLIWLVGCAVVAYGGVLAVLFLAQRQLLYFPDRSRPQLGDLAPLGLREVQLSTADGLSLLAWNLPARDGRPTILYFHGNGGHLGYRTERMKRFAGKGYGVLMPEYRGYGGNPGNPTEAGLYADAEAAFDFLAREEIPPARLVVYGESLGSGVAVRMAATHPVAALVLEAPFTSVVAAAQSRYPFVPARWLVRDRFDSLSVIEKVKAPILILHGERDVIMPVRFGRALFAAAPEPKEGWFHPEAGHNDLSRHGALDAMDEFLARRVR